MSGHSRVLAIASLAGMLACDGAPTAPSAPVPPAFGLSPGSYLLTMAVRTTVGVPLNPCVENTSSADRAAIPVVVEADQGKWRVRPTAESDLGIVATLESPSRNLVVGPIEGRARDTATGVIVSIDALAAVPGFTSPGPPSLFGSVMADNVADGAINGYVRFSSNDGSRACAANVWRLEPR
jgi:hypothetical protein